MNEYATLREMRSYLNLDANNTEDDERILQFVRRASRAIDGYTRRKFYPELKRMTFDYIYSDELRFNRDVLELKGLSDLNGAFSIGTDALYLSCGYNYNYTPYDRVRIKEDSGAMFNYQGTTQKAIHADVILGYHEDYDNAWVDSTGVLTASLASFLTTASMSASSGENQWGITPRYDTGNILRIGTGASEEYVYISSFTNSSLANIIRGINGTAPKDHASDTPIEVWQPEPEIRFSTIRLAQWQYESAQNPIYSKMFSPQLGTIELPFSWPLEIKDKLDRYKRSRIESAF